MADRFEDLRTFTAVISAGGINAAAAELGIAKSAVSRRISDLEKRLGVTLIERSTRRFEPTAVGTEYARRAAAILTTLDELDASLAPNGGSATVTISAPAAMVAHLLLPALGAAASALEGVVIRFAGDGHEGRSKGDIAVGVELNRVGSSRPVMWTGAVICASPDYLARRGTPEDPQRLRGHVAIAVDGKPETSWRLGQGTRRMPELAVVATDEDAAAAAAIASLGLVQLPDYVVATAIGDGRLVRVLEGHDPPPRRIEAHYDPDAGLETMRIVDALANAFE